MDDIDGENHLSKNSYVGGIKDCAQKLQHQTNANKIYRYNSEVFRCYLNKINQFGTPISHLAYSHKSNHQCGEESHVIILKHPDDQKAHPIYYFAGKQCSISLTTGSLLAKISCYLSGDQLLDYCNSLNFFLHNYRLNKHEIDQVVYNQRSKSLQRELNNHIRSVKDLPTRYGCFELNVDLTITCLHRLNKSI